MMVGPYRLEALLGRGGMGEVYRAADTRKRDRLVALKLLSPEVQDAEFEERFRRESDAAAGLRNPHIIPIHDYGEINGRLFLEMALIEGLDLSTEIARGGALAPARAVRVVAQIAGALDTAHRSRLLHRDVKPSNVLLVSSGPGVLHDDDVFAYLVDFGIARSMAATTLTSTGMTIGTVSYMAPERFTHPRECDHRVDVYALGCVLHEALTGHPPYAGADFPSLMYAHLNQPPPAPSRGGPHIPAELDHVVARALAKRPEDRFSSAGELAGAARTALRRHVGAPTSAAPSPAARASSPPGPPRNSPSAAPGKATASPSSRGGSGQRVATPSPRSTRPVTRVLAVSTEHRRLQHLDGSGTLVRWLVPRGAPVRPGTRLAEATTSQGKHLHLCSAAAGNVENLLVAPGTVFRPTQALIELDRAAASPSPSGPSRTPITLAVVVGLLLVVVLVVVLMSSS